MYKKCSRSRAMYPPIWPMIVTWLTLKILLCFHFKIVCYTYNKCKHIFNFNYYQFTEIHKNLKPNLIGIYYVSKRNKKL